MYGYWNDDVLTAGADNDRLYGHTGNDTLIGGEGKDTLASGEGYGSFVFNSPLNPRTNVDTLTDFKPWADQLRLSASVFSRIGGTGILNADRFWTGTKGHAESDRIIYNKKAGILYYDPDGTGFLEQIKFAVIRKLDLSAEAFRII